MGVIYNSSLTSIRNLVLSLDARATLGTTLVDLSNKNINGTLVNSPSFNSANNGYYNFEGTNQYVSFSNTPSLAGNEATFCLWNYGIEVRNSTAIWFAVSGGQRVINIHLPWGDGTIYVDMGTSVGYDRISKAAGTDYLGWHYWVFTKNAVTTSMKIYRDGVLWHSESGKTYGLSDPNGTKVLCSENGNTLYHKAYISSCQLYNRELSLDEIQRLYRTSRGRHGV